MPTTRLREALSVVRRPCAGCRGGGFAGYGSGYDAVCDDCAGAGHDPLDDPREAWEAMASAGLIAFEDVERENRRFAGVGRAEVGCVTHEGWAGTLVETLTPRGSELMTATERVEHGEYVTIVRGTVTPARLAMGPHPATVDDCLALASRWPDVLAAEELARAYHRRAAAIYRRQVPARAERIVWHVREPLDPYHENDDELRQIDFAIYALGVELEHVGQDLVMACPPLGRYEDP